MRQEPEFFGERELDLIYIGKRLEESLAIETLLTDAGVDYAVEVDYYTGGVLFRRSRAGAFFYVDPEARRKAAEVLRAGGRAALEEAAP